MDAKDISWVGIDLDGTLAEYNGWVSPSHIGKPIQGMVLFVKHLITDGKKVKILTARASRRIFPDQADESIAAIKAWCLEHIGQELEVTCEKDQGMFLLYDDRAIQVLPNTGMSICGILTKMLEGIESGEISRETTIGIIKEILGRY